MKTPSKNPRRKVCLEDLAKTFAVCATWLATSNVVPALSEADYTAAEAGLGYRLDYGTKSLLFVFYCMEVENTEGEYRVEGHRTSVYCNTSIPEHARAGSF